MSDKKMWRLTRPNFQIDPHFRFTYMIDTIVSNQNDLFSQFIAARDAMYEFCYAQGDNYRIVGGTIPYPELSRYRSCININDFGFRDEEDAILFVLKFGPVVYPKL